MNNFNQLCVWPGTLMPEGTQEEAITKFEGFFTEKLGVTIKFADQCKTLPGMGGEGGRNDVFFYIADEDAMKFSIPRMQLGIRWWEDVLGNGHGKIYPEEILNKYPKTW